MLDGVGIGNYFLSVVDAIPVIVLEHKSSPWNVLDWLSRMTDQGDWAEKFISRADEQIDRLVLKLVKSSSKMRYGSPSADHKIELTYHLRSPSARCYGVGS